MDLDQDLFDLKDPENSHRHDFESYFDLHSQNQKQVLIEDLDLEVSDTKVPLEYIEETDNMQDQVLALHMFEISIDLAACV